MPPALARHEKSNFRPKKGETSPSPRNNGETHYYENKDRFFVMHLGPDVIVKADLFTRNFQEYVRDYCSLTG